MNNTHDSLNFKENLSIDGNNIAHFDNFPSSGKIVGVVTTNEYDKSGKLLFSETTHNDITLPGSIFVLEQLFKKASSSHRFLHPNSFPSTYKGTDMISTTKEYNGDGKTLWNGRVLNDSDKDEYISDELVFGFMVGHGGESASSIISPTYENNSLKDSGLNNSYLPFRITSIVTDDTPITDDKKDPTDDGIDYFLKVTNGTNNYFYAKGFTTEPKIYTKWSDGSGEVTAADLGYNVPILTYAEVTLDIDEEDIRDFFPASMSEDCYINQLGLIAGKLTMVEDRQGLYYHNLDNNTYSKDKPTNFEYTTEQSTSGEEIKIPTMYRKDYNDVKLVTTLNFKSKDLSNDENTIKFIYKIYCL